MSEKRRQKLIYFGKRDDAIWNAIQAIPEGDQNYHMKEAFRMYFFSQNIKAEIPIATSPSAVELPEVKEDHTDRINLEKLSGLMIR